MRMIITSVASLALSSGAISAEADCYPSLASDITILKELVLNGADSEPGDEFADRIVENFERIEDCLRDVAVRSEERFDPFHVQLNSGSVELRSNVAAPVSFSNPVGVGPGVNGSTFSARGAVVPDDGMYFISLQATVDAYSLTTGRSSDDTFVNIKANQRTLLSAWKPQEQFRGSIAASGIFILNQGDNVWVDARLADSNEGRRTKVRDATLFVTRLR